MVKGIFKNNDELYEFARDLIEQARERGDEDIAQLIFDGLRSGSTASDILGSLLDVFVEIRPKLNDQYPLSTRQKLKEAIREIRAAFRRANRGL